MNKYFELMNAARKKGSKSFKYNGNTYKASKTKTGLVVYKKSGSSAATAKPMKAKKVKKVKKETKKDMKPAPSGGY